jgi:hypothetical protein
MSPFLTIDRQEGLLQVNLRDNWVFANLGGLQQTLDEIVPTTERRIRFQCGGLENLDLAGAWILYERSMDYEELGIKTEFEGFQASHLKFLQHIIDIAAQKEYVPGFFDPKPSRSTRSVI